jgi:hypothetical protein
LGGLSFRLVGVVFIGSLFLFFCLKVLFETVEALWVLQAGMLPD